MKSIRISYFTDILCVWCCRWRCQSVSNGARSSARTKPGSETLSISISGEGSDTTFTETGGDASSLADRRFRSGHVRDGPLVKPRPLSLSSPQSSSPCITSSPTENLDASRNRSRASAEIVPSPAGVHTATPCPTDTPPIVSMSQGRHFKRLNLPCPRKDRIPVRTRSVTPAVSLPSACLKCSRDPARLPDQLLFDDIVAHKRPSG